MIGDRAIEQSMIHTGISSFPSALYLMPHPKPVLYLKTDHLKIMNFIIQTQYILKQ